MKRYWRRVARFAVAACGAGPAPGLAQAPLPGPAYDCRWTAPTAPTALARCERISQAAPVIVRLQRAADLHRVASHFGPTRAAWDEMLAAVRQARATPTSERLSFRERIVAQNAALRIALKAVSYGKQRDAGVTPELAHEAAALVARLAWPPDRLREADADAGLEAWLGPRAGWVEQRIHGEPAMFHETVYLSTRSFRIVRSGERRFIFSQLVAVDSEWRVHVTSVVGDIEMRRGPARDDPACIVEFEPRLALCDGRASLAAIERMPIVHLGGYVLVDDGGRANCASCHQGNNGPLGLRLEPLAAAIADAYLIRHRARLVAALTERIAPLKAALR